VATNLSLFDRNLIQLPIAWRSVTARSTPFFAQQNRSITLLPNKRIEQVCDASMGTTRDLCCRDSRDAFVLHTAVSNHQPDVSRNGGIPVDISNADAFIRARFLTNKTSRRSIHVTFVQLVLSA
jgi:hypothetical protein